MLPSGKNDMSHEEKQAKKNELVRKFKNAIDNVQENPESGDSTGRGFGKYTDILATSFKSNASPNLNASFANERKELEKTMMPLNASQDSRLTDFQRKSIKSVNKDGKLWLILDKLKNAQNT